MSNNYISKAAFGSLLLTGASSLLSSTIEPQGRRRAYSIDDSDIIEDARYQHRKRLRTLNAYSVSTAEIDSEDEESDTEFDAAPSNIPRMRLRHPDEQARLDLRETEAKIKRVYTSVDNDEVDFGSIWLLVSLACECFEVARESYIISTAGYETNWFVKSLAWSERRFRRIYRISKNTFERVSSRLSENPIFTSTGPRPQRPVKYQLAAFLLRYGHGYSDAFRPHAEMSIGEGSVFNYCKRVVRALRMLGLRAMAWPNNQRKAEIKEAFYEKTRLFDNCIGALDGSLIDMARKPQNQGDEYLSRKKRPCINVMTIVDHECRIINCESGWPGSKNDAFIWRESWVWENRGILFGEHEYVLADKGFQLTPYVLRPYSEVEIRGDVVLKRHFNKRLSRGRNLVEMTFGRLKARFSSLYCMGVVYNMDDLYRCVEALMVLHNICIDYGDSAERLEPGLLGPVDFAEFPGHRSEEEDEEGGGREENETDVQLLNAGRQLRDTYLDRLR
ncbi:unnamed protein product [Rhizoctonia solani]|uniref:DDE Tnp4 domain-containing protein n=1 Tax=Rhizoctonia solani TaxID=456999 RepID=A0A8H3DTP7_9AGAM|nr:unnamed protein product [Rhizoctonia solani]CAE7104485.1 unnamed protein product [Rhizoctonia solani]